MTRPDTARSLSFVCAAIVYLVGSAVLLGWRGESALLHDFLLRGPTTRPVTGACLVALSSALFFGRLTKTRRLGPAGRWLWGATCLGALALALGLLAQLFIVARGSVRPASPHTVVSMALIAVAIGVSFQTGARWRQASVVLALAGATLPWIALLGYATSTPLFYSMPSNPEIGMSIITAPALLLLAVGVLGLWPDHGFVALLISPTTGGVLMRVLLPTAVLLPLASGAVLNYGEGAEWFTRETVLACTLGVTSLIVIALILGIGLLFKRREAEQRAAAAEREELLARLASLEPPSREHQTRHS